MSDLKQAAQQLIDRIYREGASPMDWREYYALEDALEKQAEPICPECKAAVLYECVACSSNNYPPKQQAEPVSMRLPKVGDKVICLEDESLATVESLTAGGSPDIVFDDGSRGTYLLREFAELFSYAEQRQQQAEPVAVERWLWIFEEKNGDRYTHKNLFYTADEAAESARICGVKAIKKIDSSKVMQQAEPVVWNKPSASFNAWWDSYRHDPANPFAEGSAAYWAWAGWKSTQRQWVGLTDEQLDDIAVVARRGNLHDLRIAIEAKLKEKNSD